MYIEDAIKKYNNLPEIVIIEFNKKEIVDKIKELENLYIVNLCPYIIYVAINELGQAEDYLKDELGANSEKARTVINDVYRYIFNPVSERLNFLNPDPNKSSISVKQGEELIIKIFKEGLANELINYSIIIEAINNRIFYVLSRNFSFQQEMVRALYGNEEIISNKEFFVERKRANSSIANWIKDFINTKGSNKITTLLLTDYITNSANAKILDDAEKIILSKVLKTYSNIKFFPESMPDDDGENWEIIPVDREDETDKEKKITGPPLTEEEKNIEELTLVKETAAQTELEKQAIEEEIDEEKKIENLKYEADKFAKGSLERRAIEEEIVKLSR